MNLARRFLLPLLLLALASCGEVPAPPQAAPPKAQAAPGRTLTLVTWNLEWFPGGRPRAGRMAEELQMAGARRALAVLKPDILLLQEIRDWDALAELTARQGKLQPVVISDFNPGARGIPAQNVAIAATLPANSAWSERWSDAGAYDPPRGFAFAAFELPGRTLLVYTVHLKSNRGDPDANMGQRMESARQFLRHAERMKAAYGKLGKPVAVLIGGDFNTAPDESRFDADRTVALIREAGFHWAHEGVPFAERISLPTRQRSRFPDTCFDHILTQGLGKLRAHVVRIPDVSDHMPVVIRIPLEP